MPTFLHKKIYLGGMAFAVPPRYIIEPFLFRIHLWRDSYIIQNIQKEHHMLRSKPTVGSVCGGACGALSLFKYKPTKD